MRFSFPPRDYGTLRRESDALDRKVVEAEYRQRGRNVQPRFSLSCCYCPPQERKGDAMKLMTAVAVLALLTAPALAQSSQTPGAQNPQASNNSQSSNGSSQKLAAAQKIKNSLQKEGFTDVKVVAESFVVQGKSPDGDPVVMTIGPHGMSVFEAMNMNNSGKGTVGSSNNSQSGSPSTNSNSSKQQ